LRPSTNHEHGATFQFTLPVEDGYQRAAANFKRRAGLAG
jgi:hypothetical protein